MADTTETTEYVFKKLTEENFSDFMYLFKEVFNSDAPVEELKKKHLHCHGVIKYVGFIAYHKTTNDVAAFYGVYPAEVNYKGKKEIVAQSGDTMTHPNHQKKGLFVLLAKRTFEFCQENNIKLIFGFPNKNSYPGFIKHLGFTEKEKLYNFKLLENRLELTRWAFLEKIHYRYSRFIFNNLISKGNSFENSNQYADGLAFMTHDNEYFEQKKTPNRYFIKVLDTNVWISVKGNQIYIGDIDTNDIIRLKKIVNKLKIITFFAGYRFLFFGGSSNSSLVQMLTQLGYPSGRNYIPIFKNLSSDIPIDNFSFLDSDIDVF